MWTYYRYDELYHHGILGQKWGKRNGPPYPLGTETSRRVKKSASYAAKRAKAERNSSNASDSSEEESKEKFHLSDKQKKYIKIGAAVATAALATGVGVYLVKSGKVQGLVKIGKSGNFGGVSGIAQKTTPFELASDIKEVNPKFPKTKLQRLLRKGYTMNCTNCVATTELRHRGMDVTALPLMQGRNFESFGDFFKGFIQDYSNTKMLSGESETDFMKRCYNNLCENLLEECSDNAGNGRGVIGMFTQDFLGGEGHVFSWEMENGVAKFYDSQQNLVDASQYFFDWRWDTSAISYGRLDNLELKDAIFETCKNVIRK